MLSQHESNAPAAIAEMEAWQANEPEEVAGGKMRWWLLGVAVVLVLVAIGSAAMFWG